MRKTVLIPTTDNWCSNYENDMVKLTLHEQLHDGEYRVSVWGTDDLGMDIDVRTLEEAKTIFNNLKNKTVSFEMLERLGFECF